MPAEMQNQKMTAKEWMSFYEELFRERNRLKLPQEKGEETFNEEGEKRKNPLPDC